MDLWTESDGSYTQVELSAAKVRVRITNHINHSTHHPEPITRYQKLEISVYKIDE